MPVQKNERALVVVSQLTSGVGDFGWLYKFLENSGRSFVQSELSDDYGRYVTLYDRDATKSKLVNVLHDLGRRSEIKEVDLIVMLHGHPNRLVFNDGEVGTTSLKNDILALDISKKLRLVYSTACFGATHADDFMGAGFTSAIGSV